MNELTEAMIKAFDARITNALKELHELTAEEPMADAIRDSPLSPGDKAVALAAITNTYGGVGLHRIADLTTLHISQCEGIMRYHAQRLGRSRLAVEFLRAYWETRSEHKFAKLIFPGDEGPLGGGEFEVMLPTLMHFVSLSHYDGRDYRMDGARCFYWDCTDAGYYRVVSDPDFIVMANGRSVLQYVRDTEKIYSQKPDGKWVLVDADSRDFRDALQYPRIQNFSDYWSHKEKDFNPLSGRRLVQIARHVSAAAVEGHGEARS